jgi:urease accessory protein UreH
VLLKNASSVLKYGDIRIMGRKSIREQYKYDKRQSKNTTYKKYTEVIDVYI